MALVSVAERDDQWAVMDRVADDGDRAGEDGAQPLDRQDVR